MNSSNILISRICHDLIAPLNAVNLGLEAFESSNDTSLLVSIKESANKANVIMAFIREMFAERLGTFCYSATYLQRSIADLLNFYNISFFLKSDTNNIKIIFGKIIMHIAIIAKEIMPFGGDMLTEINCMHGEINTRWNGKGVVIPDMFCDFELNHKNIIRYNLLKLLKESGFAFNVYHEKSNIVFYIKIMQ